MNRTGSPYGSRVFQPAVHYLKSTATAAREQVVALDQELGLSSILESRLSPGRRRTPDRQTRSSRLSNISRSPSPTPDANRIVRSDDEDDSLLGPSSKAESLSRRSSYASQRGGIGYFLLGTDVGSRWYIVFLLLWVESSLVFLLALNRINFSAGYSEAPSPVTMTWLQLILTHVLILTAASLTRRFRHALEAQGLGALIAPSSAYTPGNRPSRYKPGRLQQSTLQSVRAWLTHGSGGIAGGGLLELQPRAIKHVLPVAVVFVLKVLLSNLSYTYSALPTYTFARFAVVPLTLLFTTMLLHQKHSSQTLASALTAVAALLLASFASFVGALVPLAVGFSSSFFVALYPVLQYRTYSQMVRDLMPPGTASPPTRDEGNIGTQEETRAYWRLLHYTSLLSVALLLPAWLLSGEPQRIWRGNYYAELTWSILLFDGGVLLASAFASTAIFASFLLLSRATSPLTATFAGVPRAALQLPLLGLSVSSAVGVVLCWAASVWYLFVRRREGGYLSKGRRSR